MAEETVKRSWIGEIKTFNFVNIFRKSSAVDLLLLLLYIRIHDGSTFKYKACSIWLLDELSFSAWHIWLKSFVYALLLSMKLYSDISSVFRRSLFSFKVFSKNMSDERFLIKLFQYFFFALMLIYRRSVKFDQMHRFIFTHSCSRD